MTVVTPGCSAVTWQSLNLFLLQAFWVYYDCYWQMLDLQLEIYYVVIVMARRGLLELASMASDDWWLWASAHPLHLLHWWWQERAHLLPFPPCTSTLHTERRATQYSTFERPFDLHCLLVPTWLLIQMHQLGLEEDSDPRMLCPRCVLQKAAGWKTACGGGKGKERESLHILLTYPGKRQELWSDLVLESNRNSLCFFLQHCCCEWTQQTTRGSKHRAKGLCGQWAMVVS